MDIVQLIIGLPVLLFSAILHEIAHGYVAERLGDPTARLSGRLTLDPRKHIDPFMSIILPSLLLLSGSPVIFGGAKPVPIDEFNLKEGRKDVAIVALAGPLTNVLIAISAALILKALIFIHIGGIFFTIADVLLTIIFTYNLFLAIFNLLPIPPLDGSKIFSLLLPRREADAYLSIGSIGIFILLILLSFPIGGFSLQQFLYQLFISARSIMGM